MTCTTSHFPLSDGALSRCETGSPSRGVVRGVLEDLTGECSVPRVRDVGVVSRGGRGLSRTERTTTPPGRLPVCRTPTDTVGGSLRTTSEEGGDLGGGGLSSFPSRTDTPGLHQVGVGLQVDGPYVPVACPLLVLPVLAEHRRGPLPWWGPPSTPSFRFSHGSKVPF